MSLTRVLLNILIKACSFFQPPHLRVKKIFVGGLKPETTDQQIRDYFSSQYAVVRIIKLNLM